MHVLREAPTSERKKTPENAVFRLRGLFFPRQGPDFSWLLNDWLKAVRPTVKATTYAAYATIVERHLRPAFGTSAVTELTENDVSDFLSACSAPPCSLASSTVRSIASVLRAVLDHGARYGCRVSAAACRGPARKCQSSVSVFTEAEAERLSRACLCEPTRMKLGVLLCLHTGLRLGEVCALKWGDISPESSMLSVCRTLSRIRTSAGKTALYFGEPKSQTSRRSIPLSPWLSRLLEDFRLPDECYFLSGSAEKPVEPRGMQRHFKTLLRRAGLPERNFHALRHTFATRCVEKGFDVKSLSLILGHSDVSITLNTYVHPSTERLREMMSLLDS